LDWQPYPGKMNRRPLQVLLAVAVALAAGALTYLALRAIGLAAFDGSLSRWSRLTDPPETAARFLTPDFGAFCIESVSGSAYCWEETITNQTRFEEWREADPDELGGAVSDLGSPYPCDFRVASPPFNAIDRFDDPFCFEFTYSLDSYAISDRHEIWRWSHHTGFGSALLWGYCPIAASPVAALVVGFFVSRYLRRSRLRAGQAE